MISTITFQSQQNYCQLQDWLMESIVVIPIRHWAAQERRDLVWCCHLAASGRPANTQTASLFHVVWSIACVLVHHMSPWLSIPGDISCIRASANAIVMSFNWALYHFWGSKPRTGNKNKSVFITNKLQEDHIIPHPSVSFHIIHRTPIVILHPPSYPMWLWTPFNGECPLNSLYAVNRFTEVL